MLAVSMDEIFGSSTEAEECPRGEELVGLRSDLADLQTRYATWLSRGCRFEPNDIVTPVTGRGDFAGHPHVVLEVTAPLLRWECDEIFGTRLDMRVAFRADKDAPLTVAWVESYNFEKWENPEEAK